MYKSVEGKTGDMLNKKYRLDTSVDNLNIEQFLTESIKKSCQ
jgi:hypothetical protein